jgi:type I restriction enzyme S subunit
VLKPLDIAFNPYLVWAGAVGQWLGSEPGVTSPVYEVFRVVSGIEPRFVGLLLESGCLTDYFEATAVGSIRRRRRTTAPVFLAAPLLFPPLAEQRRIVDLIATVDANMLNAARLADQAVTLYKVLLSDTYSTALSEHRSVPLSEVSTARLGKMLNRAAKTGTDEYRYVRNADVQWDEIRLENLNTMHFSEKDRIEFALHAGDVLICEGGEVGRAAVVSEELDGIFFQKAIHRVRCALELAPRFLMHYMRFCAETGVLADFATALTITHLTGEKLRTLPVVVPPRDNQDRIVELLDAALRCEREARANVAGFAATRSALLADLLSGDHEIPESYDVLLDTAA